jgi:ABC-type amino acid transport substrate-binding protein
MRMPVSAIVAARPAVPIAARVAARSAARVAARSAARVAARSAARVTARIAALVAGGLVLAACAAPSSGSAPASEPEEESAERTEVGAVTPPEAELPRLLVASDLDNPPFAWVDSLGRPQGRDVEMMSALAHLLHRRLEWQRMPFDQLLPAVQAGRVDIVCATLGITPERAQLVEFTRPYFETEIVAVVRTGPDEPQSLAMLAGRRVAGGTGTTAERAIRQRLPDALGVFENKAGMPSAERLLTRDVDAVVMDAPAAAALIEASGGRLERLPEALAAESYALALPPGARALRAECDRALESFERAGSLARWNGKHGLTPAAAPPKSP